MGFVSPVETVEGEPMTRIRLTQTPSGSVLGAAMSHAVVDGFSYFHFLAAWSRAFRGEPLPAPSSERERLLAAADPALSAIDAGAVALASTALDRERLAREPLPALAHRVREAVAAIDAAAVGRALATIEAVHEQLGLAGLERLHVVHPRAGMLVTNLSRLPVRKIVFDAGAPYAFDVLVPAERCAIVLPADDGLDVRVCPPAASAGPVGRSLRPDFVRACRE